jgi:hypothetical protein
LGPDPAENVIADGNLYWSPAAGNAAGFFDRFRKSEQFAQSRQLYPRGSAAHCQVADPGFVKADADAAGQNDYRLQPGSPAIDAGVALPADWPDPLRDADAGVPDVGATPQGRDPANGRAN